MTLSYATHSQKDFDACGTFSHASDKSYFNLNARSLKKKK